MLRLLAALVVFAVASPAFAEEKDKPKPNTLTAKEIADGWILLFDGETTFGWTANENVFVNNDGQLVVPPGASAQTKTVFGAGELKLIYSQGGTGIATVQWAGVSEGLFSDPPGARATKALRNKGGKSTCLEFTVGEKSAVAFALVAFRPAGTKPLFTGKNLDGWKVNAADPKRMASKWDVTKDGELSLKNGPGDLVTEKEFDNFVLQFECKTLGKALNSGVFFRCIPGQYQNGYEAQIQNAFVGEDRTKPADFGTGAIYRRVPARKVVSNDNEWFTMTVVADGKHISTWVNGYQTVDWTDDRKESDNPRQGYRAAKGPLSIQGHDPTTDILFRNIRIAPLP